jgi:hypothetical protein
LFAIYLFEYIFAQKRFDMSRIILQPRQDVRIVGQQSFAVKVFTGNVNEQGESEVLWDGEKEPITFTGSAMEFNLKDPILKNRKLAEAIYQISGLNKNNGTVCGFVLEGHPSQVYKAFVPEEKAKAELFDRKATLDNMKKISTLSDAQLLRYGVMLNLGDDTTIVQTAMFDMLDDKTEALKIVNYLNMDDSVMDVQVAIISALKTSTGESKFGVRKENGLIFFGDSPIGKDIESAANWVLLQANKTEILRAIKGGQTSIDDEKTTKKVK